MQNLIYNALWFSPATQALIAYIKETQKVVNGTAKVKLYKGSGSGRSSEITKFSLR